MEWHFVQSSNVSALAKEGDDLYVMFHNGGQYKYLGAAKHFSEIIDAESVGSTFDILVKKQNYTFEKL